VSLWAGRRAPSGIVRCVECQRGVVAVREVGTDDGPPVVLCRECLALACLRTTEWQWVNDELRGASRRLRLPLDGLSPEPPELLAITAAPHRDN
jgi:hypothetical protein